MPLMVTLAVPVVAVLLAVKVSVLVLVVPHGLNAAVTPAGRPEAVKLTLPVKPLAGVSVIVVVTLAPWFALRLAGEANSAKSGVPVPGLNLMSSTGCNSMPFGATPVWPCRKSKKPTPISCTGIFAVWKLVVAL